MLSLICCITRRRRRRQRDEEQETQRQQQLQASYSGPLPPATYSINPTQKKGRRQRRNDRKNQGQQPQQVTYNGSLPPATYSALVNPNHTTDAAPSITVHETGGNSSQISDRAVAPMEELPPSYEDSVAAVSKYVSADDLTSSEKSVKDEYSNQPPYNPAL